MERGTKQECLAVGGGFAGSNGNFAASGSQAAKVCNQVCASYLSGACGNRWKNQRMDSLFHCRTGTLPVDSRQSDLSGKEPEKTCSDLQQDRIALWNLAVLLYMQLWDQLLCGSVFCLCGHSDGMIYQRGAGKTLLLASGTK